MTWKGPQLDGDQADLLAMLDDLADNSAQFESLSEVRTQLVELGLWALGASEDSGGAGADGVTTALVWQQTARTWPAAVWASVQTHVALDLLEGATELQETATAIAAGDVHPAVVFCGGTGLSIEKDGNALSGRIHRVDAGDTEPLVFIIDPDKLSAEVVDRSACTAELIETIGLDDAQTAAITFANSATVALSGAPVAKGMGRLLAGLTAIAAGIADVAADEALAYASQRRQFGDVLTAIPNVRDNLAAQHRSVSRIVNAAVVASGSAESLVETGTEKLRSTINGLIATARNALSTATGVCTSGLQSHGGYGFLTEYPAERRLRDALSLQSVCDLHSLEAVGTKALICS